MARFKPVHRGLKLLPVDFDKQVLPGSFEHALCYLVDHEFDLSGFHSRYQNDAQRHLQEADRIGTLHACLRERFVADLKKGRK